MFLFCSNQVELAVLRTICSVLSVYLSKRKIQFNFSFLTISFLYWYQNVLTRFSRTNVLNSRTMFSIQEQCSWILLSVELQLFHERKKYH